MTVLRPYQRQAIDAAWASITPDTNRVATQMATGLGKTVTFATQVAEWLQRNHDLHLEILGYGRALILVDTDKLVRQIEATVRLIIGTRWTVGVVKAGRNETGADIVIGSVQTLAQPGRREQITDVGLIVVDECHGASAPTYVEVLRHFGAMPETVDYEANRHDTTWAPTPTFGYTATLARSDGGLGRVWQDLAFSRSLTWGMRHGYLIDMVPYSILVPGVNGAASDTALDAQLADSIAPEAVVSAWREKHVEGSGLMVGPFPSTILFAPLVRSAEAFAEAFNAVGVKAEVVSGSYPDSHNRAVEERYAAGTTTVVCNAMMWTKGVDFPRTGCVVIARPTKSDTLMMQMAGRGARPWLAAEAPPREEQRCTLLVVAGASTEFFSMVADLSDNPVEAAEGKSLLAMADEFDIGRGLDALDEVAYRGPVRVERWDAIVQASSKAWKYTDGGVPFLPTLKRGNGYVFIVEKAGSQEVWARAALPSHKAHVVRLHTAPDLELAMALAEDEAQERGGDIGRLLADKSRAWRKVVPSPEMVAEAKRVGVDSKAIARILGSKSAGKAGRLSDLIDKVTASRTLDGTVIKIKERVSK